MSKPLWPHQVRAVEMVRQSFRTGHSMPLVVMPTGCHRKGHHVLDMTGRPVAVEDVVVGDWLMGPDRAPRVVQNLCRGRGRMFEVRPLERVSKPFVVNGDHVLSLAVAPGVFRNVTVYEWLSWSSMYRACFRGYRAGYPELGYSYFDVNITEVGDDDFYGFTLDGDQLYMLDDFTVTHNSGKTCTASHMAHAAVEKGNSVLWVAHREELVSQAYDALTAFGIECGVISAKPTRPVNPHRLVQCASTQTLLARKIFPDVKFLVVDECFSGDTEFVCDSGVARLRDKVGSVVRVLCADRNWRDATVQSFGVRALSRVVFRPAGRRSNHRLAVDVTPGHRWFTDRGEVTDLRVGDVVRTNNRNPLRVDREGFAHGLVYGDGSRATGGGYQLRLCGKKSRYLPTLSESSYFDRSATYPSYKGDPVLYFKTATALKELPSPESSVEYKSSFLDGLLAADGYARAHRRVLEVCDPAAVSWIERHSPLLGVSVVGLTTIDSLATNYGPRRCRPVRITLSFSQELYVIDSVSDGAVEEVFCVVEPVTRSFTLAGGLITGNCHHYASDQWAQLLAEYRRRKVVGIGLTATPVRADGRALAVGYDDLLVPVRMKELVAAGVLVPCRIIGPERPLRSTEIAALPVDAYKLVGEGRKTIVFAGNVKSALEFRDQFNAAGIPAGTVTGDQDVGERRATLAAFAAGDLRVLTNVGVACEGFDDPATSCVILARSLGSLSLYLQIVGRCLRRFPGKADAVVIDLHGSARAFGPPDEDREYSLEGDGIVLKITERAPERFCPGCGQLLQGDAVICDGEECAQLQRAGLIVPTVVKTKLVRYEAKLRETPEQRKAYFEKLKKIAAEKGYDRWQPVMKYKSLYGERPPKNW